MDPHLQVGVSVDLQTQQSAPNDSLVRLEDELQRITSAPLSTFNSDTLNIISDSSSSSGSGSESGDDPGERDTTPPDLALDDTALLVNGNAMYVSDFLGQEWSQRIWDLHHARMNPIPDIPGLITIPHPWQKTLVAQILHSFETPFRGLVVADEVGVGKTLPAIMACMIKPKLARGICHLIITTKTSTRDWAKELTNNFEIGFAPRIKFLDSNTTFTMLINEKIDFAICSYQFAQHNFRKLQKYSASQLAAAEEGELPAEPRPTCALFSGIQHDLDMEFDTVILDEAHTAKNPTGKTHTALKSIKYRNVLLITATPLANRPIDLFGIYDFLKGHPITDVSVFERLFRGADGNRYANIPNAYPGDPTASKTARLVKFSQALMVARNGSVLSLPGVNIQYKDFLILDDDVTKIILAFCNEYLNAIQNTSRNTADANNNQAKTKALSWITRAQQICAHSLLIRNMSHLQRTYYIQRGQRLLDHLAAGGNTNMRDLINNLNTSIANGTMPVTQASEAEQLNEDEQENDEDDNFGVMMQSRMQWLQRVEKMTLATLQSPRIKAIISLIKQFLQSHPNDKIVVFSKYLRVLDLVSAAILKDGDFQGTVPLRFDGCTSAEQRDMRRALFARSNEYKIILVTTGAGGAGMSLTAASFAIIAEPDWNKNILLQQIGRLHRPGQTKVVRVRVVRAIDGAVDHLLQRSMESKEIVHDLIMGPLRRGEGTPPTIPTISEVGRGE